MLTRLCCTLSLVWLPSQLTVPSQWHSGAMLCDDVCAAFGSHLHCSCGSCKKLLCCVSCSNCCAHLFVRQVFLCYYVWYIHLEHGMCWCSAFGKWLPEWQPSDSVCTSWLAVPLYVSHDGLTACSCRGGIGLQAFHWCARAAAVTVALIYVCCCSGCIPVLAKHAHFVRQSTLCRRSNSISFSAFAVYC